MERIGENHSFLKQRIIWIHNVKEVKKTTKKILKKKDSPSSFFPPPEEYHSVINNMAAVTIFPQGGTYVGICLKIFKEKND